MVQSILAEARNVVVDFAPWVVGAFGIIIAWIGGRYQWKVAKSAPASVADGYGKLVHDLQDEIARLRKDVEGCHEKHDKALIEAARTLEALRLIVSAVSELATRHPDLPHIQELLTKIAQESATLVLNG